MATTTIYAGTNSGGIRSSSTDYATARAGTGTLAAQAAGDARIGQYLIDAIYYAYQQELEFDLSALAGSTISSATLSLYVWAIDGTPGYVVEARMYDYGTSLETGDFRSGASLSGYALAAQWTTAGPDTEYKAFSDVALAASLVPGAVNRIVLSGANQRTGSAPSGPEYITAWFDNTGGFRPKLDVTYSPAAADAPTTAGSVVSRAPAPKVSTVAGASSVTASASAASFVGSVGSVSAFAGAATLAAWASQGDHSDLDVDQPVGSIDLVASPASTTASAPPPPSAEVHAGLATVRVRTFRVRSTQPVASDDEPLRIPRTGDIRFDSRYGAIMTAA